jgi:hypothetical protein
MNFNACCSDLCIVIEHAMYLYRTEQKKRKAISFLHLPLELKTQKFITLEYKYLYNVVAYY